MLSINFIVLKNQHSFFLVTKLYMKNFVLEFKNCTFLLNKIKRLLLHFYIYLKKGYYWINKNKKIVSCFSVLDHIKINGRYITKAYHEF